ncbi:hypothetical protein LQV63_07730 [Paenibacillus profundus]|uniref:Uncharacterized protein n=1 Tax=Paenibacillus profundus TaxID=1173085 RepID=A0ABS8YDS0_9BACL|nr:hypothetical protein [Paenibacillus profundus]MCE5169197.1 hypothetical protein [Paenibacillus profundus]
MAIQAADASCSVCVTNSECAIALRALKAAGAGQALKYALRSTSGRGGTQPTKRKMVKQK